MAVIQVNPIAPHGADEQGSDATVPVRYRVQTDNRADGSTIVLASTLLPQYGANLSLWKPAYVNATRFRCGTRNAVSIAASPFWFEVECEFRTQFDEIADRDRQPLDRRAKVEKSDRDVVVPFIIAADSSTLIMNTANDVPIPPLTTTIRQSVYTVRWNSPTIPAWLTEEKKYINTNRFNIRGTTWPAKTLKIDATSFGDELWHQGQRYFPLSATIIGDLRKHIRHVLNDGLYELDRSLTKKQRCMIGDEPVNQPVPLDINGRQILEAVLVANPITAPVYLDFEEFKTISFSSSFPSLA